MRHLLGGLSNNPSIPRPQVLWSNKVKGNLRTSGRWYWQGHKFSPDKKMRHLLGVLSQTTHPYQGCPTSSAIMPQVICSDKVQVTQVISTGAQVFTKRKNATLLIGVSQKNHPNQDCSPICATGPQVLCWELQAVDIDIRYTSFGQTYNATL